MLFVFSSNYFITDKEREQVLSLVLSLRKESLVTLHQFNEAFKELVSQMSDKEQEIPRIFSHLANYAARSVILELMTLSDVAEVTEGGSHYPLFMLTLQTLNKEMGKAELTKLFNDSKVRVIYVFACEICILLIAPWILTSMENASL